MAIHDLARKETPHGTVTAVWFDSEEENFVVQHEFVHLSFYKDEFASFLECLKEAHKKYQEHHHGHRE
jgi:hypothetical protein